MRREEDWTDQQSTDTQALWVWHGQNVPFVPDAHRGLGFYGARGILYGAWVALVCALAAEVWSAQTPGAARAARGVGACVSAALLWHFAALAFELGSPRYEAALLFPIGFLAFHGVLATLVLASMRPAVGPPR